MEAKPVEASLQPSLLCGFFLCKKRNGVLFVYLHTHTRIYILVHKEMPCGRLIRTSCKCTDLHICTSTYFFACSQCPFICLASCRSFTQGGCFLSCSSRSEAAEEGSILTNRPYAIVDVVRVSAVQALKYELPLFSARRFGLRKIQITGTRKAQRHRTSILSPHPEICGLPCPWHWLS